MSAYSETVEILGFGPKEPGPEAGFEDWYEPEPQPEPKLPYLLLVGEETVEIPEVTDENPEAGQV